MPIDRDVSSLPTAQRGVSKLPSVKPLIVPVVADAWYAEYLAAQKDSYAPAIPEAGPYRASAAGLRCDRQLFWAMTDIEDSNPPGVADAYRFELGHYVGDAMSRHLIKLGAGWFPEWNVDLRKIGIAGSGHADAVKLYCPECGIATPMMLWDEPSIVTETQALMHPAFHRWTRFDPSHPDPLGLGRTEHPVDQQGNELLTCTACGLENQGAYACYEVVELKTANGFSYKLQATEFKGPASGPRTGHVMQALLAAAALGCDRVIAVLFSIENLSPELAVRYGDGSPSSRFGAEWHYTVSGQKTAIDAEVARINRLQKFVDTGRVPLPELCDPEYPEGAVVVSPTDTKARWQIEVNGQIVDNGTTWMCGYCNQRDRCREYGIPEVTADESLF